MSRALHGLASERTSELKRKLAGSVVQDLIDRIRVLVEHGEVSMGSPAERELHRQVRHLKTVRCSPVT